MHRRDLKLIMDLVVNHTSDELSWFVESKSSKYSNRRNYYILKAGKKNSPPNNWESAISGSV